MKKILWNELTSNELYCIPSEYCHIFCADVYGRERSLRFCKTMKAILRKSFEMNWRPTSCIPSAYCFIFCTDVCGREKSLRFAYYEGVFKKILWNELTSHELYCILSEYCHIFGTDVCGRERSLRCCKTRPKPAYIRQGLEWIIGPGYNFGVFSTSRFASLPLSLVDDPNWSGAGREWIK